MAVNESVFLNMSPGEWNPERFPSGDNLEKILCGERLKCRVPTRDYVCLAKPWEESLGQIFSRFVPRVYRYEDHRGGIQSPNAEFACCFIDGKLFEFATTYSTETVLEGEPVGEGYDESTNRLLEQIKDSVERQQMREQFKKLPCEWVWINFPAKEWDYIKIRDLNNGPNLYWYAYEGFLFEPGSDECVGMLYRWHLDKGCYTFSRT